MRMGNYYRSLVHEKLNIKPEGNRILDVGCHDGLFLSKSRADETIGVDLNPVKKYKNVNYIRGDILTLEFKKKFNKIFTFEVIEHIKEDKLFLEKLLSLLSDKGILVLSTPSKKITIFPSFLNNFVFKRWDHPYRRGYLKEEIKSFLDPRYRLNITEWNAPFYRNLYIFNRLLWYISPKIGRSVIKLVVKLDYKFRKGEMGFLFFEVLK